MYYIAQNSPLNQRMIEPKRTTVMRLKNCLCIIGPPLTGKVKVSINSRNSQLLAFVPLPTHVSNHKSLHYITFPIYTQFSYFQWAYDRIIPLTSKPRKHCNCKFRNKLMQILFKYQMFIQIIFLNYKSTMNELLNN